MRARGTDRRLNLALAAAIVGLGITSLTAPLAVAQQKDLPGPDCTILGTSGNDSLSGTAGSDVICGLGGNDFLRGLGGNDVLRGGPGDDSLRGGAGRDRLRGDAGSDVLLGGSGVDVVTYLGAHTGVTVTIGSGVDDGAPGEGDDVRTDIEVLTGTAHNDKLYGTNAPELLRGLAGNDLLDGKGGIDRLFGGAGNDRIVAGTGDDKLNGGPGNDRLEAVDGPSYVDRLFCGTGAADVALIDVQDIADAKCEQFPINRVPSDVLLSNTTVGENEPAGTTVGTLSAVDPDASDVHTFSLVAGTGDADNGSFAIDGDHLETDESFDFEAKSSYSVRIQADDGRGGTVAEQFTITVTDESGDIPPVAVNDNATTDEDTMKTIDVLANDTDADGGTLALVSVSNPANGTAAIVSGKVDYTPDADYCNDPPGTTPDTFTYTLNGGDTATVSATVTCVDDAPVAVDDSATTTEDAAKNIDVRANDTDVDGGPMQITSVTQPANGTVVNNGTDVTYTPNANYCNTGGAPDTFDYTLTGGDTATVSVTVDCVVDAPDLDNSAGALAYTEGDPATAIDTAVTVTVSQGQITGATVSITGNFAAGEDVQALPAQPNITASYSSGTGVLTLSGTTSAAEYQTALRAVTYANTSDDPSTSTRTVTYQVTGEFAPSNTDTHAVTVTAVDDPPVAVNNSATVAEDSGANTIDVLANDTDVDAGPKSITSVTQPANGTVVNNTTDVSYSPNANYCNSPPGTTPDTFTYTLNGGSSATVSVAVTCGDDAPTAVDDSATVPEDSAATPIDVFANDTDLDGGPKLVIAATQPTNGTVVITGLGDGLTYAPNANYCNSPPGTSPDTFTYTLNGGSTATVSVTVTCGDDAPVAVDDSATVGEDSGSNTINVLANDTDTDGGPKQVASVNQPANGTVVNNSSNVSYTPNANYCGADSFTYTLNGGDSATVSVTVTCAADAPVVDTSAGATSYTENAPATAIDAAVTVADPDSGAMITGATVAITTNFAGAQDVLALGGVHPGISGSQAGNTLTLSGTATPAAYQAALRDVTYANTSEGPSASPRTVTFTVTDNSALNGSDTKSLTVTGVNDPPTAVNDSGTTDEDTPLVVSAPGVLANDTDIDPGDTKTVDRLNGSATLTGSSAEGGTVVINANGSYTYTPPAAFQSLSTGQSDTDSFTYRMTDGGGASSTATVNLTVNGVSDAPTAVADSFEAIGNTGLFVGTSRPAADAGKEITGSVLANDTDPDTAQASLVAEPVTNAPTTLGGTITIEADGNFTYHPDDVDTGVTDTFTYRVCDASPCNSGTVANATGTLSLPIAGQVWYVRNNQAAGGDGTSDTPFDTLVEAETASGTGDTVYVYDGNNTTANLDTAFVMEANERLIGETRPLDLDLDGPGGNPATPLHPGNAANVPTLTASNEDVVSLAAGVTVDGFTIDPSGTGGGIAGGPGAGGGAAGNVTVARVSITDTGTAGTQPGIDLDGTTGTNAFSEITVTNGGSATAIGVRINNAGTVNFAAAGTVTIATTGAKALDAAGTNMATSTFDDITVTGSGSGGVRLNTNTGQATLGDGAGTDLSLQTTSGATAALDVSSSSNVQVGAAGTDAISATGGPAVDIRNTNGSAFDFDSLSSTNSANDGINLDTNLATPFAAGAGAISGAAGIAFDVNGGGASGAGVDYGGAINDGSGASVEITGRDGGGVTLTGNIADGADAGGGIVVSGNSGGAMTLSGASKVLNTGASDAVLMSSNAPGSSLSFTGGGLDIDATSGRGLEASSNGGTLTVMGSGNSIQTTTGRALNVTNTPIAATDLTFERIAANGAVNGIVLNNTGASGGLTVTANGGVCATTGDACTGGTIQSTTGDAISLTSTREVVLNRMKVVNNLGNGIRGASVTDFGLRDSVVDNNADDAATDEAGLHFTNLLGTSDITRTLVANSPEDNARIINSSGTLTQLNVIDSTFRDTDTVSPGNNGLLLQADGGSITADVLGSTFLRNRANGLQVITNGTGSMNVEVDDSGTAQSTLNDNNIGVSLAHNSNGSFAFGVRDLTIDGLNVAPGTGGSASPINVNLAGSATTPIVGTVSGNTLTNSNSTTGPGIRMIGNGTATMTVLVDSNTISAVANRGIETIARDGSNRINATITNNSVTLSDALAGDAIRIDAGAVATDTTTICADIRGNTASTTAVGLFGIRVRQRFAGTSYILEDYAGAPTDDAAVQTFLSTNNKGATTSADHGGVGFTSIADCPTPP